MASFLSIKPTCFNVEMYKLEKATLLGYAIKIKYAWCTFCIHIVFSNTEFTNNFVSGWIFHLWIPESSAICCLKCSTVTFFINLFVFLTLLHKKNLSFFLQGFFFFFFFWGAYFCIIIMSTYFCVIMLPMLLQTLSGPWERFLDWGC